MSLSRNTPVSTNHTEVEIFIDVDYTHQGTKLHFVHASLFPNNKIIHVVVKKINPGPNILSRGESKTSGQIKINIPNSPLYDNDYKIILFCLNIERRNVLKHNAHAILHVNEYRIEIEEPEGSTTLYHEATPSEDQTIRDFLKAIPVAFIIHKLSDFSDTNQNNNYTELNMLSQKYSGEKCDPEEVNRYETQLKSMIDRLGVKALQGQLNPTEKACFELFLALKESCFRMAHHGKLTQHQLEFIFEHTNLNKLNKPTYLPTIAQTLYPVTSEISSHWSSLWRTRKTAAVVAVAAVAAYSLTKLL